jgi:hypothetical protein
MNLDETLARTNLKYKRYFRWKFKLTTRGREFNNRPLEEIMKIDLIKSKETYYAWEKTEEYQHLVNLYIMSQAANDLIEIYNVVCDKAKKGDNKAVDTVLKLQKAIQTSIKQNSQDDGKVVEDEDDDLEL